MRAATARGIAEDAHAGAVDKAGKPYLGHVSRVAGAARSLAWTLGCDPDHAEAVAWLHDVVEDTAVTLDELCDARRTAGDPLSSQQAVALDLLSHREGADRTAYLSAICADPLALIVKLADHGDNTDPARVADLDHERRARLAAKYAADRAILQRGLADAVSVQASAPSGAPADSPTVSP